MPRRVPLALALCLALAASAPLGAQGAPPAVPDTPAGRVLGAWLDAFNSGDPARLDAFARQYRADEGTSMGPRFRDASRRFDLVSVERSDPRRVEFLVRARGGEGETAYGVIALAGGDPPRVRTFMAQPIPPGAGAAAKLDAAARSRVIDGAIAELQKRYVFPDVARRMADSLRARRARGAYDGETSGMGFAMRLTDELREISRDKHLGVRYSMGPIPPRPQGPPPAPTPEQRARRQRQADEINCDFKKAEVLEGNVGYLKFDGFMGVEECAPTAGAAMSFLAGTRALIVDLRENGGGSPAMVAFIQSYLFDGRTHLNDLYTRATDSTEQFWTRDSVPGRKFGGAKPVYVLTSRGTFSGAEEFAYNLKALERATIVGETTGGGAHPVRGERIDEHFLIGVPFARAVNPVTKTNWEGTGVEPDLKVPAAEALAAAQRLIRELPRP